MGDEFVRDGRTLVGEQTFLLPLPPSVNQLTLNVRGRGRIKTPAYRSWITEAGLRLNLQRPKFMPGYVRMSVRAIRPDRRRRDLGNLEKAISDLLVSHGIIEDDSFIQAISMEWWGSDNMTGVSVTLVSCLPEETMRGT